MGRFFWKKGIALALAAMMFALPRAGAEGILGSAEDHRYFHSADESYYSLPEDGYATPVKAQQGGTCWVYAAATSMESCGLKTNGQQLDLDPMVLLENILIDQNHEGFRLVEGANAKDYGGWNWMVVESAANGYGDYFLAEANDAGGADIETLKELIRTYGGVCTDTIDTGSMFYMNDHYFTFSDPRSDSFDHAVVLVGWDDHFPGDYFRKKATRDGAFLAQNSRGSYWGNGGYYWISYDSPLNSQTTFLLTDEYSRVEAYDGGKENTIRTGDTTTIANVFHSEGTLAAVGTYTMYPDQKITIEVRSGELGEVLSTMEAQFPFPGYHTVKLPEPLEVSAYSIAVCFEGEAPVEGETTDFGNALTYYAESAPGQSYVLLDDEWCDLTAQTTIDALGIDFVPNNACIKALYQ